ncbi:uncharacterized protein PHACADRAFT_203033 [Phanerochaete carnosa HHB-10118-sp]|uniref:Iron-sulfur clusters transporter ATM1, mitochondrial n=1 Tax=Phanerochaete carnosa (strain HHB-10118-sp) TaxID=650164 RepID=K5UFN0_PHACS|nr:uncharacterized protein PHACADRAFT_203033 [Phanerochaete carnosa HHB-10118-sp]EKM48261.1 hypothetical protein PHACADRAFT_203033 [Phanerochaete carnosa HHB-10118-sp]
MPHTSYRRGDWSITFVIHATIFHIVPTAFGISFVCGILMHHFGLEFCSDNIGHDGRIYLVYKTRQKLARTQFRREASAADNKPATVAVDSLINCEAVKHFINEIHEIVQYDKHLKSYEKAGQKIAISLVYLDSGQNIIPFAVLTAMMFLAAQGAPKGKNEDLMGGSIRFENVQFALDPDRPILSDLSFTISAGKKVALVGSSGCGKSTIMLMLYGYHVPSSGKIYIDDSELGSLRVESVRRTIGCSTRTFCTMSGTDTWTRTTRTRIGARGARTRSRDAPA